MDYVLLIPITVMLLFALRLAAGFGVHKRTVVEYNAEDPEHGAVHVVVESNRLTGRRVRKVYDRPFIDP